MVVGGCSRGKVRHNRGYPLHGLRASGSNPEILAQKKADHCSGLHPPRGKVCMQVRQSIVAQAEENDAYAYLLKYN